MVRGGTDTLNIISNLGWMQRCRVWLTASYKCAKSSHEQTNNTRVQVRDNKLASRKPLRDKLLDGNRTAEQVSLQQIDPLRAQVVALCFRFYPFCDEAHI